MTSLKRLPVVFVVLTSLVLSGLVGSTAAQDASDEEELVHITNWNIGDYWHYEKTPGPADGTNARGTWIFRVDGVEQVELSQWSDRPYWSHVPAMKQHTTFRVASWLNQTVDGASGPMFVRLQGDNFYRTDDQALAMQDTVSSFTNLETGDVTGEGRIAEFFPPRVTTFFPFAVGDKWQVDAMRLSKVKNCQPYEGGPPCDMIQGPNLHVYEVIGEETITLPIGGTPQTFDAYLIRFDDMNAWDDPNRPEEKRHSLWWYVPEVCRFVREEHYSSRGELIWRLELTDYKCSERVTPDPAYRRSLYSFDNLSSLRYDGKLAPKTRLKDFEDLARGGPADGAGGFQLGNLAPGFEVVGALGAVLAAAAVAARRRE